jgi:hypothetical protein
MKKRNKDEEEWLINHEKKQIDSEIERQNREHEEKVAKDAIYKKEH